MGIDYSDGPGIEKKLFDRLSQYSQAPRSDENPFQKDYAKDWALRYHFSSERSNLLRPFDFTGLEVLELGAGMGALSRHLAEQAGSLYVVEGTPSRYEVLEKRLADLTNWQGEVCNFQDFKTQKKFDVVTLIGVLEYSELYLKGGQEGAFHQALGIVHKFLKPQGVFILAIENALGLKYFAGAHEDHTARPFDGITGYGVGPSARTFSRAEIDRLLKSSGFINSQHYFPFPDYKITEFVVSEKLMDSDPDFCADLLWDTQEQSYSGGYFPRFPLGLGYKKMAQAGLLKAFAPSFLVFSSPSEKSATLNQIQNRFQNPLFMAEGYRCQKARGSHFLIQEQKGGLEVYKEPLSQWVSRSPDFIHHTHMTSPRAQGRAVKEELLRALYFREYDVFTQRLVEFLSQARTQLASPSKERLLPQALDALWINAFWTPQRQLEFFDLEYETLSPMRFDWFIFRNLLVLRRYEDYLDRSMSFPHLWALYEGVCQKLGTPAEKMEELLVEEARFQSWVDGKSREEKIQEIKKILKKRWKIPVPLETQPLSAKKILGRIKRLVKALWQAR